MSFERPLMLVALAAVPLLAALWLLLERRRRTDAERFTASPLLPNLVGERPAWRRVLPPALLLAGVAVLTVGAARPRAEVRVPRKEATILLAVDVSRSMRATDVLPSRGAAAVRAADAFLDKVPSAYKVGVIGVGSRAFVAVPPTIDRALAHDALFSLTQSEGTALGDAIALGVRIAKRQRSADGFVPPTSMLLISDGARDGGRTTPAAAAKQARAAHLPVSTVLVGTPNGVVTVPLTGGYEERIRVPANVGALRTIARTSGGRFYRARTATALQKVYEQLGTRVGHTTNDRQIADVFAAGGIVLLLASAALSTLWFRRVL
ncbi:MAG TPA: VWA domain-containing protein [Gaiellaceae bacterium]|nr:VWA domain-containing protein [Gaiellaceae bacterium]